MMKDKYDTSKYIDTYMHIAHDAVFTKMSEKNGIKKFGEQAVAYMFKEYQ